MTFDDLKVIEKALLDYGWFHETFKWGDLRERDKAMTTMLAVQDVIRSMDNRQRVRVEISKPLMVEDFNGPLTLDKI